MTSNTDIRDEFRQKFDSWAPEYSQDAFTGAGMAAVSARELSAIGLLGDLAGKAVLDVGVGTGRVAAQLLARGARVTGVDQAPGMLAASGSLDGELRLVEARLGDPLPFADQSFAAISCLRVIKYVENTDGVLAEFARLLEPGGSCLVEFSNRHSLAKYGYDEPVHLSTVAEVEAGARKAGLTVAAIELGTHIPHPVWRWATSERRCNNVSRADSGLRRVLGARGVRSFTLLATRA